MMNYNDFSGPYLDMARKAAEPWLRIGEVAQKNAARVSELMLENARKLAENANQSFSLFQKAHSFEDLAKCQLEYAAKLSTESLHQGQKAVEVALSGVEELRRVWMQEATDIAKHAQPTSQKKN